MTEPNAEAQVALYPIDEKLIANYVHATRIDLLVSLFNTIKSQRDRAEANALIYQTEVHRLNALRQGASPNEAHHITTAASPALRAKTGNKFTPAKPVAVSASASDIDVDDL